MPLWSMDDWQFVRRETVVDPRGKQWSIALMDVLGQAGDPDRPSEWLELQYASGRYFTLIYSASGALQRERGHPTLEEATIDYDRLVESVIEGRLDPAQPVFRQDLED